MEERFPAGWALPVLGVGTGNNARAHYYSEGFRGESLCGKYVILGGQREDDNHSSPDNCRKCMERLAKARPDLGVKVKPRLRVTFAEPLEEGGWTYARKGDRGYVEMERAAFDSMASRNGSVLVVQHKPRKRSLQVKARALVVL
jgi:hypothetical protein